MIARAERDAGIRHYFTPVLAGLGEGGSAARALSPSASGHQIAGVVAVRSGVTLNGAPPLCGTIAHVVGGGRAVGESHPAGETVVYEAPSRSTAAPLRAFAALDPAEAADAVQALEAEAGPRGPGEIADLPLVVTRPPGAAQRLAVLLTGDGGLDPLDQDLGNALAARGMIVATLDSRRYFWSTRDPASLAADLARILRHFRHEGPVRSVALVGYSFGADVLPLAYTRLTPQMRGAVGVVSLISLAPAIDFRIEFDDRDYLNAVPLLPDAARIDAPAVQCLYGEDDAPAALACPALGLVRPGVAVHRSTGGHGLDGDMERVADIITAPLVASEAASGRAETAYAPRQGRAWRPRPALPTRTAVLDEVDPTSAQR